MLATKTRKLTLSFFVMISLHYTQQNNTINLRREHEPKKEPPWYPFTYFYQLILVFNIILPFLVNEMSSS